MNKMIRRLFELESAAVLSVAVFLVLAGIAFAVTITSDDRDGDGVPDTADLCPNSLIDNPTKEWGVNRYLWVSGGSDYFKLLTTSGEKVQSEFTMAATGGCSCADILTLQGATPKSGQFSMGCSRGVLQQWINKNDTPSS